MEEKIHFILNTSGNYFNTSPPSDDTLIRDFYDNDEINLLAATVREEIIYFHHRIPAEDICLLFYKIPQLGLQNKNKKEQSIGMLTLEGGIIKSIYNSISRVYSPYVSKRSDFTPEIARIIENLHTTLGSSLGLLDSGIQNIQDEVNFWTTKSTNSSTKSDKENAKSYSILLDKINTQLDKIENNNTVFGIEEFVDSANNILDELWRLPHHYPQNRMKDIMNVICSNIIEVCIENMANEDIWNVNSIHINTLLSQITDIVDSWIQVCDTLTRLFWPNYNQHSWIGEPHIPNLAAVFKERLLEIKHIKNLYIQVYSLFNNDENYVKMLNSMFSPFKDMNIFDTSTIGQQKWQRSVKHFESVLEPIDDKIANILKNQLHNQLENPRQVIHIFLKYDLLTMRPSILESLTAEREHFLHTLDSLINDLQTTLSQTSDNTDFDNLSPIVWETRWLKVVEHQIYQIEKVLFILKDRKGFESIERTLKKLQSDVSTNLKDNFRTWCEDSIAGIKSGDLKLREDKSVVEFEKGTRQYMIVTFNPKIVTFCHDVREFENLGCKVPIELLDSATHALKFMSYARALQQISSFHNTIGDRMIPCQRPIMLKNAVELSNLVQSESVAWNDEESVSRYVTVLQVAVHKLSNDNTLLASYHEKAKKTVIKLMKTDLLRNGQIWKDEMRRLRDIIANLESQGYTNLQAFKLHWDYQLYKVLEYQYISGLVDLNQKLPDIEIDLVFRQQQLQFKPALEEIRSKYYSQLRRFLERPLGFRGLSDQSNNLFQHMVGRNRFHFTGLYKRGEEILNKLNDLKDAWLPWVALGRVELDQLCSVHLSSWLDWDNNFKACKHFSQQIAKIQNSEERIDCFVINLSPLRSDIEFISRRYWDTLTITLRSSIVENISTLQDFYQSALQVLQNVPIDETGIADAGAKYENIIHNLPKMSELLKSVQEKDTCLAGWCKERVSSLNSVLTQWDQLQPLIENHHSVLQRQIDIMKDHISGQINNLNEEVEKFQIRWESTVSEIETNENTDLNLFKERQNQWSLIKQKTDRLFNDAEKFNTEFPKHVKDSLDKIENDVQKQSEQWNVFEQFIRELEEISNEEWTIYRRKPYLFTDFLIKWQNLARTVTSIVNSRILNQIEKYQSVVPILQYLQSDSINEKYWAKIFVLLNKTPKPCHEINLKEILSSSDILLNCGTEIQNLVRQASSEQIVRQTLTELEQWGVAATLKLVNHTDNKGQTVMLIKDFQEVLNKIGDNLCLLQSVKNSTAFEAFSDQAEIWNLRLNNLDRILSSFSQIQRKWIYLEPIFGSGTLRSDEAIFIRIDKDFRFIMQEILNDSRVLSLCKIHNIITLIDSLENQLSRCLNTLTSYITTKRNAFPRFYFLGNDDLLEILGQASREPIIQKHIKKLFPGIHHVGIISREENLLFISSIKSAEGDEIKLKNIISINGPVEEWLNQLVTEIKCTLSDLIFKCCQHDTIKEEEIKLYPMQIVCLARYIAFTKRTERAINAMGLSNQLKSIKEEISNFTTLISNENNSLFQIKLRAILIDLVHQSSIVEHLLKKNVTNQQDWHWLQQIKFYLNSDQSVTIKMVHAEFDYSYEYLGNVSKLVNTSLTHKCYLTLTQAMHLGLGGNPFGPAGTGKTECVKALGAMLGRLVLVFNCNENVDTEAMGLILTGLARCGAWGCFDEFNRLQETTLSAISMLIQPLQTALKHKKESVAILDDEIPLNLHCGIFVTLNPAGEEYGGRQKLPTNLQALFRPIVMQQPEPTEIATVLLFVEGFKNAHQIGGRMVELFNMAGKMLSKQRHYDWGLRELKTVLTACGKMLRENSNLITNNEESEFAVQALRINTMSKLTVADCKRFDMLVSYVFPHISPIASGEKELRKAVAEVFTSMGYKTNDRQVDKCLELYEQLLKRMGVVIIGPPNSGKTTLIFVLKQALSNISKTIRSYTIAPKSMTRTQLLGKLDPDTRQWNDGVLTTTAVAVNSELHEITSWIICDGDIDPEWIEALNSVLDDNRLLTLPSGWRIQFGDNVNFIFETHDLSNASPATISRMGIVNLSSEDLSELLVIESWLEKQINVDILRLLFEQYFMKALNWILENGERPIPSNRIALVQCGLQHLETEKKEEFCIALIRGLGSTIYGESRKLFAKYIFNLADIYITDPSQSQYTFYNRFRDIIEIYEIDRENSYNYSENEQFNNIVKTPIIKTELDVLRNFLKNGEKTPFLLYGPNGCGKTLLIQNAVSEFSGYQFITIKCSAQLTSSYVLYILKQNCLIVSGVRGREYIPRLSKIVLYFKNIDYCPVDCWGSCEVIELLLQLINRNGFYAENMEWISISALQICGSFSDATKKTLSPRFLSIIKLLIIGYPNLNDMQAIFLNQFAPIYKKFNKTNKLPSIDRIVDCMINIYNDIKDNFKSDISNHYVFTPKMVTNWIYSLVNYPEEYLQQAILYEAKHIFKNRLISNDDSQLFDNIFETNIKNVFRMDQEIYYFLPIRAKSTILKYTNEELLLDIIQKNISICATENVIISKPVTQDLIETMSSICLSLSKKGSNLILCGRIGSGRKEALHIACSVLHIKIFLPQPIRNYSINDFYNDLKMAMQTAALEDQSVVFLIDQTIISCIGNIMKPIEAVLEGSEIPDLFGDDLEGIANPLRNSAQTEGYQDSLGSYFLKRVENNLHLVLTLESSSKNLNDLFSKYPALYRNTNLIWLKLPGVDILEQMPRKIIEQMSSINIEVPILPYFSKIIPYSGDWSSSPLRYNQLIQSYFYTYNNYSVKINKQYEKLHAGVEKLSSANNVVATLKSEAKIQEVALAEKRKLAAQALEMISSTMRNATNQRTDLLELKRKTQESSEILKERKVAIELELKDVEPILKEASAAVGQIKSEALSEIRSLRAPPDTIRDILEGVLLLMGIKDTSWNSMKTFLAKRGVKEDIRSLDPSRISPENCNAVEKVLQMKSISFDTKNAKRASVAAAPLATWVIANVKYSKVIQSIKPLEHEQNQLVRNLAESENEMKSLMAGLDDVESRVQELSSQLNGYTQEAAVLEIKLSDARTTLAAAETLIEKLNSEFVFWSKQLEDLKLDLETLDLKSFIVSISITHLSHLSLEHRMKNLNVIYDALSVPNFNINEKLITEQEKLLWENMGLTADTQSMQNAAILLKLLDLPFKCAPIPVIKDPSGTCFQWIQAYLTSMGKSIEVTLQNADRFTYQLELAVKFGKILIIQEAQIIVPPLISVINSEIHSRFNKKLIQVGNKLVDLHEDFKLILFTKMHHIQLNADIDAYLTTIPFTITISGLTDQLLSKTIALKRPELEEKRISLLQNEGSLWKQRLELQDTLLHELSTAKGDILKNEKLIKTLNDVKESSILIDNSLLESSQIRKKLMEEYFQFKMLCSNASTFYVEISKIYYISVSTYTQIFLQVIEKNSDFEENKIYRKLIRLTYTNISRTVVKSQHLALALCVCKTAFSKEITDQEWESFITNFIASDDIIGQSLPEWIKNDLTTKVSSLQSFHSNIYTSLQLENESLWEKYCNINNNDAEIPINLSDFQKILISQIFRPDLMLTTMYKSAAKILGLNVLSMPQLSILQIVEESKKDEPILLITLSGTDPSKELKDYAQQKIGLTKYIELSVGKENEEKAKTAVRVATENGTWICLKNVHLIPDWLNELDNIIQSMKLHDNFRMFLTSESDNNIPESFKSKCNKILYEAPDGIKNKIQRLLQQWGFLINTKTDQKFAKLYNILFILNAVFQERRSFIPQGWCKWYEFGDADLSAAIEFIGSIEKSGSQNIEWSVLRGLCENIAYGGRIDNTQDLNILSKHLEDYFSNDVMGTRWTTPFGLNIIVPQSNRIQDYYTMVSQLPDVTSPEMLGLSSSTSLSRNLLVSRNLLKELRSSHFKTNDKENFEKRIKPILSLWKKLINGTNIIETFNNLIEPNEENTNPWRAFLICEVRIAKLLFTTIHTSLSELHLSMKQMVAMSDEEIIVMNTICENQVLIKWRKIWAGPKLATDYLKACALRGFEAYKRLQNDAGEIFAKEIDLASVYNVDAFLAALKLSNARVLQQSTYDLVLKSKFIQKNDDLSKNINVNIRPLLIDGASFKNGKLCILDKKNEDNTSPSFDITYDLPSSQNKIDEMYICSLYSNINRDVLLSTLEVPISSNEGSLIYSGGALIVPDLPL